jgi:PAS domain S-box-containing protein
MPEAAPQADDTSFRLEERSFRALMENVQDMVALLTREGRFVWGSPSTERVLGYAPEQLVGRSALEMIHPHDRPDAESLLQRTVATPQSVGKLSYRVHHRDGSWRVMEATGKNLLDDGRVRGIVLTARDVTQRVAAAEQLDLARAAAEKANAAKTEFLSRMSHELRTPLNAILGFAQLLAADLHDGGPGKGGPAAEDVELTESVEQILRAGRHLMRLIDEVLEISRIEIGQLSLSLEPIHLDEAIHESIRLVTPLAASAGIEITVTPSSGATVRGDVQRVRQILRNLLTNAIKYNRPGGRVWLRVARRGKRFRVSVADTGMGIDRASRHSLFTPFQRLGAETTGIDGTGLGLALSHRLAYEMNGSLTVRSRRGYGSSFRLELPESAGDAERAAPLSRSPELLNLTLPQVTGCVLAVDDNTAGLRLLEGVLARVPELTVRSARSAAEAVAVLAREPVHLLILDLHLPDTDGRELLTRLRAHPASATLPVIIVTADATAPAAELMAGLGARAVITKPFDTAHLLKEVAAALVTGGPEPTDAGPSSTSVDRMSIGPPSCT